MPVSRPPIPNGESPLKVSERFPKSALHVLSHLCVRYDQAINQILTKMFSKRAHPMNYGILALPHLQAGSAIIKHLLHEHLGFSEEHSIEIY